MRAGALAALFLAVISTLPAAAFELAVEPAFPREGETARITVTDGGMPVSGAEVSATYRPNSEVIHTARIGLTDDAGTVLWTPDDAGLAQIDASRGEDAANRAVSVRFPGLPGRGLVVFLLAGLILFGGNILFVTRTLRDR